MSTDSQQPKSAAQRWRAATEDPSALLAERDRLREELDRYKFAFHSLCAGVDALEENSKAIDEQCGKAVRRYVTMGAVAIIILMLTLSGCAQPKPLRPIPQPQPDVVDGETHSDEEQVTPPAPQGIAVSFGLPPNTWNWLQDNVKCLTMTVEDKQSFVAGDGTKLDVPAGCHVKIEVDEKNSLLTFSKPYPHAKGSVLGVPFDADVTAITLKPDGSGLAQTAKFGSWGFRWLNDGAVKSEAAECRCGCSRENCDCSAGVNKWSSTGSSQGSPKLTAYYFTATWCSPCVTFGPRFKALAAQHGMAVTTVDVDAQPDLWSHFAAKKNSIPQVAIYVDGKLVDSLVNPTDEAVLRAMGVR